MERRKKLFLQDMCLLLTSIAVLSALLAAAAAFQKVEFADEGLEAAVREKLGNPQRPIARTDLLIISNLDASGRNIARLDGIENMLKLVVLDLARNRIEDVAPLRTLRKLRELNLDNNGITELKAIDFDALDGVPLRNLNLSNNWITSQQRGPASLSDISLLSRFTSLEELDLTGNPIEDITPLGAVINVRALNLKGTRVTDISALANLTVLEKLNLRENDIADLTPLSGLTGLTYLNLHSNSHIRSIMPLERLTGLKTLIMRNVPVGDGIRALGKMNRLNRLNVRNCDIEDITPLGAMIDMRTLNLRGNRVTDISALANLTALTELNLRGNDIADLTPLSGLTGLTHLNLHSNSHIRSIMPLERLTGLETLIMRDVPVGDGIRALGKMDRLNHLNVRNCGINDTSVLGALMAEGVLQDDPEAETEATVNILENPLPEGDTDPYLPIRTYWRTISWRSPIELPYAASTVDPPVFSRPGGFYDESFELKLTSAEPDAAIYYTLDGSLPTEKSPAYAGPFLIQDPAVRQGTVVRAMVVAKNGKPSNVVTHTYFVGPPEANRHMLPVISLVTDLDYLFGRDIGIYGLFFQRGRSWERPISIELFGPDGTLGLALNGGVRIHGGTSRRHKQKALRLYARPEYDSDDTFKYNLFPGLTKTGSDEPLDEFKTLILRTSGSDFNRTMFRDVLMQGLVEQSRNLETQASRPVILYINGMYWGLYNLRERYDEDYIAMNYDVSPDDVVILEGNAELKRGDPGDENHYLNLRDYAETYDLSDPVHYRHLTGLMDMRSYIEFYAANIYFNNTDWPHNNNYCWRIKTTDSEGDTPSGHDGRWRWMLSDTDFGFGCRNPGEMPINRRYLKEFRDTYGSLNTPYSNTLKWATLPRDGRFLEEWPNILFRKLLDNEEFRTGFINHLADQLNSAFHPERVRKRIDGIQETLSPEMKKYIPRWKRAINNFEGWQYHVQALRNFATQRPDHVRRHIIDHFGLSGTVTVSLRADAEKGHIQINGLKISKETPGIENPDSWTGVYFKDIPVTIAAIPEHGYRFACWEGIEQKGAEVDMVLTDDITLTARFAKE